MRVYTLGDFGFKLPGATIVDIGRPVFATADDALTLEKSVNSPIGWVANVVATGEIVLRIDGLKAPQPLPDVP